MIRNSKNILYTDKIRTEDGEPTQWGFDCRSHDVKKSEKNCMNILLEWKQRKIVVELYVFMDDKYISTHPAELALETAGAS